MKEDYHKWYSQWTGEDFEMLVFGHSGIPMVLFPFANARYYDCKDFGIIESLREFIEGGKIKVYCPDSRDADIWMNYSAAPAERIHKYLQYEQMILHDVIGFANFETERERMIFTGLGLGGYYALNISFKYPEISRGILTFGSSFDIKKYIFGYYDDDCFYNNPSDYLPGLTDKTILDQIKSERIIITCGTEDKGFEENKYISRLLFDKKINHLFDVYKNKFDNYEACKYLLNANTGSFV